MPNGWCCVVFYSLFNSESYQLPYFLNFVVKKSDSNISTYWFSGDLFIILILGTASAIKFDPRESYLQYYFPQQALTTNPRSFGTDLKNAHILPNFKHNASQRSRKQNGRIPSFQTGNKD